MKGLTKPILVQLTGMDDRAAPAENTALLLRNVELSADGWWRQVGGTFNITQVETLNVSALHWFNPRGNVRWLVVESEIDEETSSIAYIDWTRTGANRGTPTTITTRRRLASAQLGTQFLEYGRWLYLLSPLDALVRWDGARLMPAGFTRPPSPPLAASEDQGVTFYDRAWGTYGVSFGDNTLQRGVGAYSTTTDPQPFKYGYAVTEINDLFQESPPSSIAWVGGENAGVRMCNQVQIARAREGIIGRRLWRTQNLWDVDGSTIGVPLYLLAEFGHGGPITYADHAPDGELGPELDLDNTGVMPPGARAMAFWQGMAWLGGMPDDPTTVRHSAALFPEQWPAINTLPVGSARTGAIVAFLPLPRGLAVFKTGGVYLIKGNPVEGFRVETVDEHHGCDAPQALVFVPGVGAMFLNHAGPHVLIGTLDDEQPSRVVPMAAGLRSYWRRRVGSNLRASRAVFDVERGEVWFAVPESGDPHPKNGLVFHIHSGEWSIRQNWEIGAFAYYRGRTFLGSWHDSGVYVLTHARRARFGDSITSAIHSNPPPMAEAHRVHRAELVALASGGAVQVEARVDKAPTLTDQGSVRLLPSRFDLPRWDDSTVWDGGATWADLERVRVPVSLTIETGVETEVRLTLGRFALSALILYPGDPVGPQIRSR